MSPGVGPQRGHYFPDREQIGESVMEGTKSA